MKLFTVSIINVVLRKFYEQIIKFCDLFREAPNVVLPIVELIFYVQLALLPCGFLVKDCKILLHECALQVEKVNYF